MAVHPTSGAVVIKPNTGGTITIVDGVATDTRNSATRVNELRKGYSQAILSQAAEWAKSKGWTASKMGNKLKLKKGN